MQSALSLLAVRGLTSNTGLIQDTVLLIVAIRVAVLRHLVKRQLLLIGRFLGISKFGISGSVPLRVCCAVLAPGSGLRCLSLTIAIRLACLRSYCCQDH